MVRQESRWSVKFVCGLGAVIHGAVQLPLDAVGEQEAHIVPELFRVPDGHCHHVREFVDGYEHQRLQRDELLRLLSRASIQKIILLPLLMEYGV